MKSFKLHIKSKFLIKNEINTRSSKILNSISKKKSMRKDIRKVSILQNSNFKSNFNIKNSMNNISNKKSSVSNILNVIIKRNEFKNKMLDVIKKRKNDRIYALVKKFIQNIKLQWIIKRKKKQKDDTVESIKNFQFKSSGLRKFENSIKKLKNIKKVLSIKNSKKEKSVSNESNKSINSITLKKKKNRIKFLKSLKTKKKEIYTEKYVNKNNKIKEKPIDKYFTYARNYLLKDLYKFTNKNPSNINIHTIFDNNLKNKYLKGLTNKSNFIFKSYNQKELKKNYSFKNKNEKVEKKKSIDLKNSDNFYDIYNIFHLDKIITNKDNSDDNSIGDKNEIQIERKYIKTQVLKYKQKKLLKFIKNKKIIKINNEINKEIKNIK